MKKLVIVIVAFFITSLSINAQTATGSMKFNLLNFKLSEDSKTISYDVYVQDIDVSKRCGIAGYTIRVQSPRKSLGNSTKTVIVTNQNAIMGAGNVTVSTVGTNWMIKFSSTALITTWSGSQMVSEAFPGTMLATVNISNTDGSSFSNNQSFNIRYSPGAIHKSMLSLFQEGTNRPASDAITAIPITQFVGVGSDAIIGQSYGLEVTSIENKAKDLIISTNQTSDGFYINMGDRRETLNIFDVGGKQLLSTTIVGRNYIDISSFNKGVYLVVVNKRSAKVMKL